MDRRENLHRIVHDSIANKIQKIEVAYFLYESINQIETNKRIDKIDYGMNEIKISLLTRIILLVTKLFNYQAVESEKLDNIPLMLYDLDANAVKLEIKNKEYFFKNAIELGVDVGELKFPRWEDFVITKKFVDDVRYILPKPIEQHKKEEEGRKFQEEKRHRVPIKKINPRTIEIKNNLNEAFDRIKEKSNAIIKGNDDILETFGKERGWEQIDILTGYAKKFVTFLGKCYTGYEYEKDGKFIITEEVKANVNKFRNLFANK